MRRNTTRNGYVFAFDFVLHDRLRKSLEVHGGGVQAMADRVGVSRNTVGNWLAGRSEPPRSALMVWSTITNCPLEWLETGDVPRCGTSPAPDPELDGKPKR